MSADLPDRIEWAAKRAPLWVVVFFAGVGFLFGAVATCIGGH